MQHFLALALFSVIYSEAADISCPQSPITSKTPNGRFPIGGITVFPANYDCAVEFEIPDGQVIKFITQTNIVAGAGDSLTIRDSVSTLYEMNSAVSVFYSPANNSKLWITTKTSTSYFYFNWQYMDVTKYNMIQKPTGSIIPMNLTQNSYYQFVSNKSRVAFHTGNLDKTNDLSLSRIYVYDGDDLNSKYIGTLQQFMRTQTMSASTGSKLVLVNYYGTDSGSWGVANDYSAVYAYDSYSLFVLSKNIDYTTRISVPSRLESAITFYCIDSVESYITNLNMVGKKNGAQAVRFKPLTPTDVFTNLLVYNLGDPIPESLPQQIMSNTFTMVMYQCDVQLGLISGPLYIWTLAAPGRRGSIISPSIWNPRTKITTPYFTNITTNDRVKFVFNLREVIVKAGEKIRIEIGSADTKPVFVEFNETAIDTGTKAAYGTYMATTFTGTTVSSEFSMTFSVEGNATTTTVPVETTTKSSPTLFSFSILTLLIVKLF